MASRGALVGITSFLNEFLMLKQKDVGNEYHSEVLNCDHWSQLWFNLDF